MKKRYLLFLDTVCPNSYSPFTLAMSGLGGTEATTIRIAESLGVSNDVVVMQHNRNSTVLSKATYAPIKAHYLTRLEPDHVIVLRNPQAALNVSKLLKKDDSRVWLWLHDLIEPKIMEYAKDLGENKIGIITVSNWLRTQLIDKLRTDDKIKTFPSVTTIYNPIDDALTPNSTDINRNKLVFFSSPHKGLHRALEIFKCLRNFNKDFKLYISNPGYFKSSDTKDEGVINLDSLPHSEIIQHVREALCVFYPNFIYPETFGLVMAEANAVGTPVITHSHGAAPEVLKDNRQFVNCRDNKEVIDRVMHWYNNGRPDVKGEDNFRLSEVIKRWNEVLDSTKSYRRRML